MRKRFALLIVLLSVGACVLLAADFWDNRSFTEWNDNQVQKILENSPWAQSTPINVRRADSGGGMSIVGFGFQRGGGGGVSIPSAPKPTMATVRWESALPVRQAIARQSFGDEVETSPDAIEYLGRTVTNYVVRIIGVPSEGELGTPEELTAGSQLVIRNQPPVPASQVQVDSEGRGIDLFLVFPKAPPAGRLITVEDRQVQVVIETETVRLRRRFNLNNMDYQGKLEL